MPKRKVPRIRGPVSNTVIGARLAAARHESGMSQGRLGNAVGLSQQMIGRYESGKAELKVQMMQAICTVIGITVGSLFD